MKLHEMEHLIGEAVRDADLRPEEIPAIDLYLDQIISLVTDKRMEGSAHYRDRELTKTMINNYSKDGLIAPIKGKKYSKEHIIQMLLVYDLKNTLSIGEIKRILQNVYGSDAFRDGGLEDVYCRYLAIKEFERQEAFSLLETYLERADLDPDDDADFLTLLLGMASVSAYLKSCVQVLLKARYPDLDEEKTREEQARREEAKRQKAEKKAEAAKAKAQQKKAVQKKAVQDSSEEEKAVQSSSEEKKAAQKKSVKSSSEGENAAQKGSVQSSLEEEKAVQKGSAQSSLEEKNDAH